MALFSSRFAHAAPCRQTPLRKLVVPRVCTNPSAPSVHVTPKQELLDLCDHAQNNGVTAPEELRRRIKDTVEALEKENSVPEPANGHRALLDGMWALEYTTTRKASSGKLGPFVGEVTQEVDVCHEYYINHVKFGPLTISLTAHWNVLDDFKWRVYFKDMSVKIFGTELYRKPFPPDRGGYWKMTYVDDNLRLLRTISDKSGSTHAPLGREIHDVIGDIEENLFVLTRIPG